MAIVTFINIFFEGGVNINTVRTLSSEPNKYSDYFSSSFPIKIVGGLLTIAVTLSFLLFTHYKSTIFYLILISLVFIVFNALLMHLRSFFRAFEIMKYEAYSIAFEKIGLIILCGGILLVKENVILFTSFYALTYVIAFFYTLALVFKIIGTPNFKIQVRRWFGDILKPAFPFAIMNILLVGRSRAGTLLLKFITHRDDWVGYYNAGYRLLDSFLLFPNMITTPLLPVFVRFQYREKTIRNLLNSTYRSILSISILIAFPIFILHKSITLLLFGPTFSKAALTVGIIALNMIPVGLTTLMGNLVAATGRQPLVNKLFVFETLTTVALHSFFIYLLGYVGAAIASFIGDTIYLSINTWVVRDYVHKSGIFSLILKILIIFCALVILQTTSILPENTVLQIMVVVGMIVTGLFSLRIIRKKEIHDLRKMIQEIRFGA